MNSIMSEQIKELRQALGLRENDEPFPWQCSLLECLMKGIGRRLVLDVPTGLGKTSVMAAWLIAKANGAALPRRLIYVVDRRAVVDQATREAVRLRTWVEANADVRRKLNFGDDEKLQISTLRGQFADNGQWLANPSSPAMVVGTVDMIGSRLLFEGYGVSRKMRPYHAGLLGIDSLFVIDESHLVPPFEALLDRATKPDTDLCGEESEAKLIPRSVVVSLSATGRDCDGEVMTIDARDVNHPIAGKRLRAVKRLKLIHPEKDDEDLVERLASEAWKLSDNGASNKRIIVFCNSRSIAMKVEQAVMKFAKGDKKQGIVEQKIEAQLFVGSRRVRERQQVEKWLEKFGFLAGSKSQSTASTFVFATSAGEVGVDLDADHMVCDLVAFERMVQRLGRVNRRGEGDAEVHVLLQRDVPNKKEAEALSKAIEKPERQRNASEHELVRQFDLAPKYRAALEALPTRSGTFDRDASPEALRQLKLKTKSDQSLADILSAATTPKPLRPELSRPILDSWSMTSLEKHSARPFVAPWLRGWVDDESQTTLVWRKYLPTQSAQCSNTQILDFFEAAPLHLTETLDTGSDDVFKWLLKRVDAICKLKSKPNKNTTQKELDELPNEPDVVAILIDRHGDIDRRLTLGELQFEGGKEVQFDKKRFSLQLANATLIVDSRIGGLSNGLLDDSETELAVAADAMESNKWIEVEETSSSDTVDPIPVFRIFERSTNELNDQPKFSRSNQRWKVCLRFPIQSPDEDEPSRFLTIEKFRKTATSEESRSTIGLRTLQVHLDDTEKEVDRLAERLGLSDELTQVFRIAARNHDHGKNSSRWQNAFSAPEQGGPYAKTPGPFRNNVLDGYRHEFGSLPMVSRDPDFNKLSNNLKDLTLHLVAAHHGFARPIIRTDGCEDAPPSVQVERARDVALRFALLQKQWGPWGLAWLESILRAADHRASALVSDEVQTDAQADSRQHTELEEVSRG